MIARGAIHARLYKGPNENRDDLIDAYRDEIAHKLAEQIRADMDYRPAYGARKSAQVSENLGRLHAADLIDPEVKS